MVKLQNKTWYGRDIHWGLYKWNDMMSAVCLKILQRKKWESGWWIDKVRLRKCCELLKLDDRFMEIHYAILSTFRYIWNIPYHNKKLSKYLFQERKAIFGSALRFRWAHFCTPVKCILKFPVYYYLFCMNTTGKCSIHLKNSLQFAFKPIK